MEAGLEALASGAVFRLSGEGYTSDPSFLHRLDLIKAQAPRVCETTAAYFRLAEELRAPGVIATDELAERMEWVRVTRGSASDYLLEQGEDDLSEAGENYLRSSEWARRVLGLAPWTTFEQRTAAAELLEHMAGLEEEALEELVRFAGG
jgi:hypothetical protein